MDSAKNPFCPTYGIVPKVFMGREDIVREFLYGLELGPGDPNRSTVLAGARGVGKTTVLKAVGREAERLGWIDRHVLMKDDFLEAVYEETKQKCKEHMERSGEREAAAVSATRLSIDWGKIERAERWEERMRDLLAQLSGKNVGVVFEIDELHGNSAEFRRFASFFQQRREEFKVALLMAGLPHRIDSAFNDKVASFLRRSRLKQVGLLSGSESRVLIRRTFSSSSKPIADEAVDLIAEKSGGYPYLIQLLGYEVWEKGADGIGLEQARAGISRAEAHIGNSLIELIMQDLSPLDRRFVDALASLETPARVSDLRERAGFDGNTLNQYRRRLDREGVVHSPSRGYVDFVIPYMKEYLRDLDSC